MSTIITTDFRVKNTIDFINTYKFNFGSLDPNGSTKTEANHLYVGLGRDANPWVGTNVSDSNPPPVIGSDDEIYQTWFFVKSIMLFPPSQIHPIVPRWNWQDGNAGHITFKPFDNTIENAHVSTTPFYCINTDPLLASSGGTNLFQVYELTTKNTSSAPVIRPIHTSGQLDAGDGYTWNYLFTIPAFESANILDDDWIPIIYNYSSAISPTANELISSQFIRTLKAQKISIKVEITSSDISIADLDRYRQVSIIANPTDKTTGLRLTVNSAVTFDNAPSGAINNVNTHSGHMLFLENISPIVRQIGQNEIIKLIIEF